jgi:hypothetical protein
LIGHYSREPRRESAGRAVTLIDVVLPFLLIGHSKFAAFEVEAQTADSVPWRNDTSAGDARRSGRAPKREVEGGVPFPFMRC